MKAPLEPVRWDAGAVNLLDQRLLPGTFQVDRLEQVEQVAEAIETLAVRGAPAIGIAAAYGVVLGALRAQDGGRAPKLGAAEAIDRLKGTRPTAVNLFHDLNRMQEVLNSDPPDVLEALLTEAHKVLADDLATGERIAEVGLQVLPPQGDITVLTHCNAGGLATGGWGTALAPVYLAHDKGRRIRVLADETRPLFQGSRLTAWEMARVGIPVSVVVDGAAASLLKKGDVDVVITGADRIALNGDTANKIGTYPLALAAKATGVPFYIAAPLSTFDRKLKTGGEIPVEVRSSTEVLGPESRKGVDAVNLAFDVTPHELIHGWITEIGLLKPPFVFP